MEKQEGVKPCFCSPFVLAIYIEKKKKKNDEIINHKTGTKNQSLHLIGFNCSKLKC